MLLTGILSGNCHGGGIVFFLNIMKLIAAPAIKTQKILKKRQVLLQHFGDII
jgi:hypothetical protein